MIAKPPVMGVGTAGTAAPGQYLTFTLADQLYGLEINKVKEIVGIQEIVPVPCMPEFVLGVINLRGKIISVTDLRLKFGLPGKAVTPRTCIIVVEVHAAEMSVQVDTISEVFNFSAQELEPAPEFGARYDAEYLLGIGKLGGQVAMLLDIEKLLTSGGGVTHDSVMPASAVEQ